MVIDGQNHMLYTLGDLTCLLEVIGSKVTLKNMKLEGGEVGVCGQQSNVAIKNLFTKENRKAGVRIEDSILSLDEKSDYTGSDGDTIPFIISVKDKEGSAIIGSTTRLFKEVVGEDLHLFSKEKEVIDEYEEGKMTDFKAINGTNDNEDKYGSYFTQLELGRVGQRLVTLNDVKTLKVHLKQSNLFLASNTLQLSKLSEEELLENKVSTKFNIGRSIEDEEGNWIEGVYKIKGLTPKVDDVPNIVSIEMLFKDGSKNNFSVKLDDEQAILPEPFLNNEITELTTNDSYGILEEDEIRFMVKDIKNENGFQEVVDQAKVNEYFNGLVEGGYSLEVKLNETKDDLVVKTRMSSVLFDTIKDMPDADKDIPYYNITMLKGNDKGTDKIIKISYERDKVTLKQS